MIAFVLAIPSYEATQASFNSPAVGISPNVSMSSNVSAKPVAPPPLAVLSARISMNRTYLTPKVPLDCRASNAPFMATSKSDWVL